MYIDNKLFHKSSKKNENKTGLICIVRHAYQHEKIQNISSDQA